MATSSSSAAAARRFALCALLCSTTACAQANGTSNSTHDIYEGCEDVPGWHEGTSDEYGCSDYVDNAWCTTAGEPGDGWELDNWGFIEQRSGADGLTALDACCGCGGGQAPHDGRVIRATFSTTGVDFAGLMADATMASAFKAGVEHGIRYAGNLRDDAEVSVRLRKDGMSVQSQATIMTVQSTSVILDSLHSNVTLLTNAITDHLWMQTGVKSVSTGVIRTSAVTLEAEEPVMPDQERCLSLQVEIQRQGCDFPSLFDEGYSACVDLENADGTAYWEVIEAKEASCYACSGFNLQGCVCTMTCQDHGGRWCDPPHRDPYCAVNCRERVTISAGHLRWLEIKGVKARTCDNSPGLCPSR